MNVPEKSWIQGNWKLIPLIPGDIHLWIAHFIEPAEATIEEKQEVYESYLEVLDQHEFTRYLRYIPKKKKREFVGSRYFLKKVMGRYISKAPTEIHIAYDASGKPYLAHHPIEFSLAHHSEACVCSLAQNHIGVDIEVRREIAYQQFVHWFNPSEFEQLMSIKEDNRWRHFLECWSLKEALYKLDGLGKVLSVSILKKEGREWKILGMEDRFDLRVYWVTEDVLVGLAVPIDEGERQIYLWEVDVPL